MAFDINLDTAAIRDAAAIDHCNDSVRNCPYERQNRLLGEPFAPGRAQHRPGAAPLAGGGCPPTA
jgi:hypothetical protein